jgi:hypothetical protein
VIIERVIWTTLPHGFTADGLLRVSLHVAPRLTTDDTNPPMHKLGDFPSFLSWPDRLATLEFEAVFDNGQSAEAKPAPAADPALWDALFGAGTPVRPHAYQDHALRDFHVFPVRPVLTFLKETYGGLAAAGPGLPSIDDPTGPLTAFEPLRGLLAIGGSKTSIGIARSRAPTEGRGQDNDRERSSRSCRQVVVVDDVPTPACREPGGERPLRRIGSTAVGQRPAELTGFVGPKPTVPSPGSTRSCRWWRTTPNYCDGWPR